MNTKELEIEHRYRITERLAIMCGEGKPTDQQTAIATAEADATIAELTKTIPADHQPELLN